MKNEGKDAPENEENLITKSMQIELLAATFSLITEALEIWALFEEIEEIEEEARIAQEDDARLQQQFKEMQEQINELKGEVARLKKNEL